MQRRVSASGILLSSVTACGSLAAGCAPAPSGEGAACTLGPGDLVITEIMANPPGRDTGTEWWEIHNPGPQATSLEGLTLAHSEVDGTSERREVIAVSLLLAPGGYVVVGDPRDGSTGPVAYSYAGRLGALGNTNGRLALYCGDVVVDEVTYVQPPPEASLGFDGAVDPEGDANDELGRWCAARSEYAPGAKGTPGARNDPCTAPTTCRDGEGVRPMVTPGPGDLLISEVHANPRAVPDAQGEFVELLVVKDLDLNGIWIGKGMADAESGVSAQTCLLVQSGTHLVVAGQETDNGGLPRVDIPWRLHLANAGGTVVVGWGDRAVDSVSYPAASDGASWQLDEASRTELSGRWCTTTTMRFGSGDLGSPGLANELCPEPEEPVASDRCSTADGQRPIASPAPGQILLTEIMPNPESIADADGEYFELTATADVDLNGVQVARQTSGEWIRLFVVEAERCLRIEAGRYAVVARQTDDALNGGLGAFYASPQLRLNQTAQSLGLFAAGADLASAPPLDSHRWEASTAGAALCRVSLQDDAWGTAGGKETSAQYAPNNWGTPGFPNDASGASCE